MIVTVVNESACSGCHAKGACTVADIREKDIEITNYKNSYSPGQQVTVSLNESNGMKAVFYGYFLPFIIVVSLLVFVFSATGNELASGLASLAALVPYYLILYFFRHRLRKAFIFEIEE